VVRRRSWDDALGARGADHRIAPRPSVRGVIGHALLRNIPCERADERAVMGRHKKSRSLASRKRAKDVSGAMLENTVYHKEGKSLLAEPPQAGFDTALPRKFREMQRVMQHMRERESGKAHSPWRAHFEDTGPRPRPQKPPKASTGKASTGKTSTDDGPAGQPSAATPAPSSIGTVSQAAAHKSASGGASTTRAVGPVGAGGTVASASGQKRKREVPDAGAARARVVPKFGETNDAPPMLMVGGRLAKQLAAQRTNAHRADQIAQQRQSAIASYKAAKAARRAGPDEQD